VALLSSRLLLDRALSFIMPHAGRVLAPVLRVAEQNGLGCTPIVGHAG
jgi:hypothetical protein